MVESHLTEWKPRYFDVGVNFSDGMFKGFYHGSSSQKHPEDIEKVIERSKLFNIKKMLITASSLKESEEHIELCEQHRGSFFSTVGVHPCTVAQEFYVKKNDQEYSETLADDVGSKLAKMRELLVYGHEKGLTKACGEIGLDYDRLHYSSKEQQKTMFSQQLEVLASLKHLRIPLFLHMRSACDDFVNIIKPFIERGDILNGNGVVHSFTGTADELQKILDLGFFIGINGCSLKSEENLKVAALVPPAKLMVETDAPWCEIRRSHAGYKYLKPYPNIFYPEVKQISLESPDEGSSKNLGQLEKALEKVKLDDFVPFPSIKRENFTKHEDVIKSFRESKNDISSDTHGKASYPIVKSRNEPVFVGLVVQVMCHLYNYTLELEIKSLIDTVYENTCDLFKIDKE